MNIGEETAARWREAQARRAAEAAVPAPVAAERPAYEEPAAMPTTLAERLPAILFAVVGAIIVAGLAAALEARVLDMATLIELIGLVSGPLALVAILYMLLFRTSRREARRFGRTAQAMRGEAAALERVLATLSDRIEENRRALAEHAQHLLALGEEAAGRLADVGQTMRAEAAALSRQSDKLDEATATARTDLGVLLTDLPRAEAQTREMAAALRAAGLGAHEHAGALETRLATLAERAREADEGAGGAAQRLAAQLARIEGVSTVAAQQVDDAAARMSGAIDTTLEEAARALDEVRRGIDGQQQALLAMVETGGAALASTGEAAAATIAARLQAIRADVDALGTRIGAEDAATAALLAGIERGLGAIEARFAALAPLGADAVRMADALTAGGAQADALIARAETLRGTLAAAGETAATTLPTAFAALLPDAARLEQAADATAARLDAAAETLARQQATLAALDEAAGARIAAVTAQTEALGALIDDTATRAQALADGAAPQLVDALLRVRDTAQQSAEHAREALAAVIPDAAAALGQASGAAMEQAVRARVETELAAIAGIAERGVLAAEQATARLARQLATVAETSDAIDARIEAARAEAEEHDEQSFSRRVALLIESLNSTAIDVTKILSNDVTDSAWTAYLKGDRGIFTRRAVRLLDRGEARTIARHYEEDVEFREQVNRYVHDFEAMLRRVLATRDGTALAVTLLSSDMGKLYVALAQAIERLR